MPPARVRVTWSPAHERLGLPTFLRTVDPSWRGAPGTEEGWSLVLTFAVPPREQGNPSLGLAECFVPDAPADWLMPGATLHVFERATQQAARVDVLD